MGYTSDVGLVGRDDELRLVRTFLTRSAARGGSLLLSGEPGVGKTAVLDAAEEVVSGTARVLRGSGVPSESDVGFSGLHQLLVPLFAEFDRLPLPLRSTLEMALGLVDGPRADLMMVSTATLTLLRSVATTPLVMIIDDLQWLDQASCAVVGFVGRRLAESRIGLLAARRPESGGFFDRAGLHQHELPPLDTCAASDLLRVRFPAMPASTRQRVVLESRGIPLALIALAATVAHENGAGVFGHRPQYLANRGRMQASFAAQMSELPAPTRPLLLTAAWGRTADGVAPQPDRQADLIEVGPGERAGLIEIVDEDSEWRSRHSLITAARTEPANQNEHKADRTTGSGLRSAAATTGRLMNADGDIQTAHRLLAGRIAGTDPSCDREALRDAVDTVLLACLFGGSDRLWKRLHATIGGLQRHAATVLSLSARMLTDPLNVDESVLAQLDRAVDAIGAERDPARIVAISVASFYTDRLTACTDALQRVVRDGTEVTDAEAQTSVPAALLLLCFDAMHSGRWDAAERLATQVIGLCESRGARAWTARYALSLLAALRGQEDRAQTLTEEMMTWAAPRGIHAIVGGSQHARALAAIGRGDFEEAYRLASVVSPPGHLDGRNPQGLWLTMDLVEAAVRTGRLVAATEHVEAARERCVARISGRFALLVAGAEAMAAPDSSAAPLFEEALALPGNDQWPFEVARIHLAFGERLRRDRSITRARWHLTAASDAFDQLGAQPWMRRASAELRATSMTRVMVHSGGPASLTPQEREVAELAATGMTNKQIGAQLYLSHRTVAAHLYRVFPKLAVTTRAALRDALTA